MKLNIKSLEESDYEQILVDWWKDWKWEAPIKRFLTRQWQRWFNSL